MVGQSMAFYLESGVITHLFRTNSFAKPQTIAICLTSGNVRDTVAITGTLDGMELANTGAYARQLVPPLDANWNPPVLQTSGSDGSGVTANTSTIIFPVATADWGFISCVALTDSGVYNAGNILMFGPLAVPKTILNGDQFKINAGDLSIAFD